VELFQAGAEFRRGHGAEFRPPFYQGRRELGGDPGQIFLGAYFKKIFLEQQPSPFPTPSLPDEYDVIAFQRLYLNFSYQISLLCPKNPNILPFARKYFFQKNDWGPTKISRGPHSLGAGAICPPLGGPSFYKTFFKSNAGFIYGKSFSPRLSSTYPARCGTRTSGTRASST
jgi:hypothetical protein